MEFEDYENKYFYNLSKGKAKLSGIKKALNFAKEYSDTENTLKLYFLFLEEDFFNCDGYQSIFILPECLDFFYKHPEFHNQYADDENTYLFYMAWHFKWFIESIPNFYQVPIEQIQKLYHKYMDFCKTFGYSERSFYESLKLLFNEHGFHDGFNVSSMKECYTKDHLYHSDEICESYIYELQSEILYLLKFEKNPNKALQKAKIYFTKKIENKYREVCAYIYSIFAYYYLLIGDGNNIKKYTNKYLQLQKGKNEADICIECLIYIDTQKALKIFNKQLCQYNTNKNPLSNFHFYLNAYRLMEQLENSGQEIVNLNFPFKNEHIYNSENIYNISDIKTFMYNKAKFLADKFDKRNSNNLYNDELSKNISIIY